MPLSKRPQRPTPNKLFAIATILFRIRDSSPETTPQQTRPIKELYPTQHVGQSNSYRITTPNNRQTSFIHSRHTDKLFRLSTKRHDVFQPSSDSTPNKPFAIITTPFQIRHYRPGTAIQQTSLTSSTLRFATQQTGDISPEKGTELRKNSATHAGYIYKLFYFHTRDPHCFQPLLRVRHQTNRSQAYYIHFCFTRRIAKTATRQIAPIHKTINNTPSKGAVFCGINPGFGPM